MLRVGAAIFLGLALIVVVRWLGRRIDALGRERPFPWFSTTLLVVIGGLCLVPGWLTARLEHRLRQGAEVIVGAPVEVHCQSFGEAFTDVTGELGYVAFGPGGVPEHATLIKREQCRDLSAYIRSDGDASPEQIVAVHVLTHEAIHMSGVTNEAQTECLAIQHDAEMARLLGASPEDARELAVSYWRDVYPHMPPEYRSEECGPGKAFDLGTAGAPWPPAD